MKKFNFKINNFYSIFGNMPGDNSNRNLDSYLDGKLRNSLSDNVHDDFTFELMKRVELQKEFAKEDVKTFRIAKSVISGFIAVLCGLVVLFTITLKSNQDGKDVSFLNSVIERFSYLIESTSLLIADTLGFAISFQTGFLILLAMVIVFLFSFADRSITKRFSK